ncbi:hypothetical protein KCU67_g2302, partial [Aureobasidium melanogenum]
MVPGFSDQSKAVNYRGTLTMLKYILFTVGAVLITTCTADRYTYWVHDSCSTRDGFDVWLREAFEMADRAHYRLESNQEDMQTALELVMGTNGELDADAQYSETGPWKDWNPEAGDPRYTAKDMAMKTMKSIATDWTLTNDQAESNVRFYCNQDQRWQVFSDGSLYDPVNGMRMVQNTRNTCETTGSLALTYHAALESWDQNARRNTISLCDKLLHRPGADTPKVFAEIDHHRDLRALARSEGKLMINYFKRFISPNILHEMAHTWPYRKIDIGTNFWRGIFTLDTQQSVSNADNYAFLGIYAKLLDIQPEGAEPAQGGWAPTRKIDYQGTDEALITRRENARRDRRNGKIEPYADIIR